MRQNEIVLLSICVALNVAIGSIVFALHVPLYLDSIGIALCALTADGTRWRVLAAAVSAPVVVYLFGGVTASGTALLVTYFLKTGQQLMSAALYSGFTAEPVDKTMQALIAYILFSKTPNSFLKALTRT